MKNKTQEYAHHLGKGFSSDCDLDCWQNEAGRYKASVYVGEDYYVSDPYKAQDLALCEVKGWLEGTKVKIESTLKAIDEKLKDCDIKNK